MVYLSIYCKFLNLNGGLPTINICNITPHQKISDFKSYPHYLSTYGAIYPGDPHFKYAFLFGLIIVANPKSDIFIIGNFFFYYNIKFYNLISL